MEIDMVYSGKLRFRIDTPKSEMVHDHSFLQKNQMKAKNE
jgi:hypothetical protein